MSEWLDDNGYPTDAALDRIKNWPVTDAASLGQAFAFIRSIWNYADWGWTEKADEPRTTEYQISTGGWSGNEDTIGAMHENAILWSLCWVSSRRGGHHVFQVRGLRPRSPTPAQQEKP